MKALQELTHILDYVMPGIKKLFSSWNEAVYGLASSGIPSLPSGTPSTKMLVQEAVSVLRTVDSSLDLQYISRFTTFFLGG